MKETQKNRLKWKKSKMNWFKWKKTESSRWIETTCETVSQIRLALHLSSSQGKVAKCVQNNKSTEIPGSHMTSLFRVSEGCKQAIRATFSLESTRVSFRSDGVLSIRWPGRGPNGIFSMSENFCTQTLGWHWCASCWFNSSTALLS